MNRKTYLVKYETNKGYDLTFTYAKTEAEAIRQAKARATRKGECGFKVRTVEVAA